MNFYMPAVSVVTSFSWLLTKEKNYLIDLLLVEVSVIPLH